MDYERKTMKISKTIVKKNNSFASGIRVLVVDNDSKSLKSLKEMLKESSYKVVGVDNAEKALDRLHQKGGGFDLLLVDANLPLMNGLDLLQTVNTKFKIPVLMMCSENKINIAVRALKIGASFVFSKPINKQNIQNMWQHVRNKHDENVKSTKSPKKSFVEGIEASSPSNNKVRGQSGSSKAKTRIVWTPELHHKFLQAIHRLGNGFQNAFPERILKVMNIKGLTREHVASHLQKFRLSMKSTVVQRNRWNSPNGFYSRNFGVSYYPSCLHHKEPQYDVVPYALPQQMPTAVVLKNENNDLSSWSHMTRYGSQGQSYNNNIMNQGSLQNPIMINEGGTPQSGGTTSNYMMPMVDDRVTNEVSSIRETFQNVSTQSQEVSPSFPILDSGNMDAFVTDTEGLETEQVGIDYSPNQGNPNMEWSCNLDDVLLNEENQVNASGNIMSMNLDGDINGVGMLNINTEIGQEDVPIEENKGNYSDKGKSAMPFAEKTEDDDSWLEIFNVVSQQGNKTVHEEEQRDNSIEALVYEMQQGDDPMSDEDIDFLLGLLGDGNSTEI